jgi:hypothetical protein
MIYKTYLNEVILNYPGNKKKATFFITWILENVVSYLQWFNLRVFDCTPWCKSYTLSVENVLEILIFLPFPQLAIFFHILSCDAGQ